MNKKSNVVKRFLGVALALAMVFTMNFGVFAADSSESTTKTIPLKIMVSADIVDEAEDVPLLETDITVPTNGTKTVYDVVKEEVEDIGLEFEGNVASDGVYIKKIGDMDTIDIWGNNTWEGYYWKLELQAGSTVTLKGTDPVPDWAIEAGYPAQPGEMFSSLLAPSNIKLGVENFHMYTYTDNPTSATAGFVTDTDAITLTYVTESMSW